MITWNKGENFPSLGIGHFIWYPKGKDGPFHETFPQLVQYIKQQGASSGELYALIDYINFKGEGISPKERYKGQGWGLLQVLKQMKPVRRGKRAIIEFSKAAKKALTRRVYNSPKKRYEKRWLKGWKRRISSYAKLRG